jgi:thiamine biosynthesis protein ThiS
MGGQMGRVYPGWKSNYNPIMNIILNGQPFDLPEHTTVAGLVKLRRDSGHLKTNAYAVELNREVCLRPQHESTALKAGDKVEVVVMVGGG